MKADEFVRKLKPNKETWKLITEAAKAKEDSTNDRLLKILSQLDGMDQHAYSISMQAKKFQIRPKSRNPTAAAEAAAKTNAGTTHAGDTSKPAENQKDVANTQTIGERPKSSLSKVNFTLQTHPNQPLLDQREVDDRFTMQEIVQDYPNTAGHKRLLQNEVHELRGLEGRRLSNSNTSSPHSKSILLDNQQHLMLVDPAALPASQKGAMHIQGVISGKEPNYP